MWMLRSDVCAFHSFLFLDVNIRYFSNVQAIIAQQDSQIELQHTFQSKSKQPIRHYSSVLLEQEKQRNTEKHKEELANLHKLQAQHREEQQRWEKEKERQRAQIESLEARLQQREDDCLKWEEKLREETTELQKQRANYQQGLERLRDSTKSVDKERERLNQEKERVEQLQEKIKKLIPNAGLPTYDDPTQVGRTTSLLQVSVHPSMCSTCQLTTCVTSSCPVRWY